MKKPVIKIQRNHVAPEPEENASPQSRSVDEKVEAARLAAVVLRPHGGCIPNGCEFDRGKIARLKAIFENGNLPEHLVDELIQRTQWAAIDLAMAKPDTTREAIKKIEKLAAAAQEFSSAWRNIGRDLQRSLACHMEGRLLTSKTKATASEIVRLNKRTKRIEQVASGDLFALIGGAAELAKALKANSAHRPREYLCALAIGHAWLDCTGDAPAVTRNKEWSDEQQSRFQRFVSEALGPKTLSDAVIRDAIQLFELGAKPG